MTTTTPKELLGTTAPAGSPTTAGPRPGATPARRTRSVWAWSAAAAAAAVTIVAIFTGVATRPQERVQVQQVTSTGHDVDSQEFLNRLANSGYIPSQAVDQKRLQLERAVRSGQVPAAALHPMRPVAPLYSSTDTKLIESVGSGHVPADVLDSRALLLKRLANEGKIPREASR